ncbi:MAG: amino-acid N-acetyltransferase [Gammaproteobacteria bacterium]|jgi:amino-acid N-acetyltransferase|nr:amino-acid N-acetyltransferase [Gammaproteobacteria bacterium]MDP6732379.1 amino-acid N-acetyltransferase [Gammaproteobacteria bacterium]
MTNNKENIAWFRASTRYINAHRNKIFVVLLSGEALADKNLPNIVYDLNLLHSLGVKLVLVHGARPQITTALDQQGRQSNYYKNLRITEAGYIETIKQTVGSLSLTLESLFSLGISNSPMHGADIRLCRGNFVTAKPVGIHDGIDFQYTGQVRKIQSAAIEQQLNNNNIVMLSNLGYSLTGEVFNLSAEEIATKTAIALKADKLILLIPSDGVIDDSGKLVASLTEEDARCYANKLANRDDVESVCIRQALLASLRAYAHNVHRSHLISYKSDGALLQELFSREGNGSLLSGDNFDRLRDADINDVAGILTLIKPLEENGTLVKRSRELLETEIDNFKLIELEGATIACAAIYPISEDSGEVACIAIDPRYYNKGYGDQLLSSLETTAREKNLNKLFVLTTVAAHWFLERGFVETDVSELPEGRKQLYNYQRKSKVLQKILD